MNTLLAFILEQFESEIALGWFFRSFRNWAFMSLESVRLFFASFVRQGLFACRQTGMIATVKRSFS
ncbi:protein of unknown function [Desulfovibrio sp. 86]|nr:protein of unknown function [Desulfovibrio sp. 86]